MKKTLLTVAMLLSAAGIWAMVSLPKTPYLQQPTYSQPAVQWPSSVQISTGMPTSAPTPPAQVNCLPQNTSYADERAQKWASYENCVRSAGCSMAAPQGPRNSPKYGPGHPTYEQYKACAIKNNQKPVAAIYSTFF